MYNILLTDDEQIVIDSLTMILNRNFQNDITITTALSGTKALETVRSKNIDIIFMDIHMPGINGLETISLVKQINPNIIIIILSAYDQFHYAQEAMNLGAYKYLTKPVNRNLIVQTLRDAMNIVDSQRGKLTDSIELHEKLSLVSTMVESDFIYTCIFNSKNSDFSEYVSYFNIEDSDYFMCCMEVPDAPQEKRYSIYIKIRDILTSKCRCIIGSFMGTRIGVFFPIAKNGIYFSDADKKDQMKYLFTRLSTEIGAKIKMGVSETESSIEESHMAYNNALAALNSTAEGGGLAFFEDAAEKEADESEIQKKSEMIIARIKAGDVTVLKQMCRDFTTTLYSAHKSDLDRVKNSAFEFLLNARNATVSIVENYKNEAFSNAFTSLAKINTHAELENYLCERCMECASAVMGSKEEQENPIITKACNYIEEHLSDNIGLEQLAEIISVSPYYLSKLFKEEKGENFINYVTSMRLEKARQLLSDNALIIKEVTAAVGYNDQNYFSRLFKQRFGMTPTEFRESAGGKREVR